MIYPLIGAQELRAVQGKARAIRKQSKGRQSKDHSILIFLCNINRPNTVADQNFA